MADNYTAILADGTTGTFGADNVSGVLYSRVKLQIGADGERADVDGGQQAMANSVPVVIASDQQSEVAIGATTDASVATDTTGTISGKLRGVVAHLATIVGRFRANQTDSWAYGHHGLPGLVRVDVAKAISFTDGKYAVPPADAYGRPFVVPNTGATDGAAAAGEVFPVAGVYQQEGAVSELANSYAGRIRVSQRRATLHAPDHHEAYAAGGGISTDCDFLMSTTDSKSGFTAIDANFLDGSHAGYDGNPRWVLIPMRSWRDCSLAIYNNLTATTLTVSVIAWLSSQSATTLLQKTLYTTPSALGSYGTLWCASEPGGPDTTSWVHLPALRIPMYALVLALTPSGDPAAGSVVLHAVRRS